MACASFQTCTRIYISASDSPETESRGGIRAVNRRPASYSSTFVSLHRFGERLWRWQQQSLSYARMFITLHPRHPHLAPLLLALWAEGFSFRALAPRQACHTGVMRKDAHVFGRADGFVASSRNNSEVPRSRRAETPIPRAKNATVREVRQFVSELDPNECFVREEKGAPSNLPPKKNPVAPSDSITNGYFGPCVSKLTNSIYYYFFIIIFLKCHTWCRGG